MLSIYLRVEYVLPGRAPLQLSNSLSARYYLTSFCRDIASSLVRPLA